MTAKDNLELCGENKEWMQAVSVDNNFKRLTIKEKVETSREEDVGLREVFLGFVS